MTAPNTPQYLDDFVFTIAATWREWIGGRITEETAMVAIGDALTELREQREQESEATQ